MIDFLRKTVLAGVGATVVTAERLDAVLKDLVDRGELSAEEAMKTKDKITSQGKKEFQDAEKRMGSMFDDFLRQARVASQQDLVKLAERVTELEKEGAAMDKTSGSSGASEAAKATASEAAKASAKDSK